MNYYETIETLIQIGAIGVFSLLLLATLLALKWEKKLKIIYKARKPCNNKLREVLEQVKKMKL
jgi:lipopolysaccharide/colanic/teichoic acid biosynthesis glycosyltransferase